MYQAITPPLSDSVCCEYTQSPHYPYCNGSSVRISVLDDDFPHKRLRLWAALSLGHIFVRVAWLVFSQSPAWRYFWELWSIRWAARSNGCCNGGEESCLPGRIRSKSTSQISWESSCSAAQKKIKDTDQSRKPKTTQQRQLRSFTALSATFLAGINLISRHNGTPRHLKRVAESSSRSAQ